MIFLPRFTGEVVCGVSRVTEGVAAVVQDTLCYRHALRLTAFGTSPAPAGEEN